MRLLPIASLCVLITLLSVSSGCKKNSEPTAPPSESGGTSGTPVSPAQRKAAIDAVAQADSTIDWTDPQAAKQQLLHVIQSRSEFEASGANNDASVWARFTDDRLLIIVNNRAADDTSSGPALAAGPHPLPTIAGGELPKSRKATVMSSLGTLFTNTPAVIAPMFQAKGYTVSQVSGSISNLKSVNGDAAFYMAGHGGEGTNHSGLMIYSIWTSDMFDTVSDRNLKTLWDNGELTYMTAEHDRKPWYMPGSATIETHFAITAKFVANEMSFGQNSLIYFNSCGSSSPSAIFFMNTCLAKSAGNSAAYAGWTNPTTDNAATVTAYFIIDRLLGTNMDPRNRENPPQRPFTYPQIMAELAAKHLGSSSTPAGPAFLTITPATASFGMFAPSIEKLTVDERNHELDVFGLFGSDLADAQVTLNDQSLTLSNKSPGQLVCSLDPKTQNTGGDVKVIVHGDTSNVVRLTEWQGQVMVAATSPGFIGYTLTYSFHIRADVHSFRTAPGGTPEPEMLEGVLGMPDSRADCIAGGSVTDVVTMPGGCTEKLLENWGSVHDSASSRTGPSRALEIAGDVRPQANTLSLYLSVAMTNFLTDTLLDSMFCPNSTPTGAKFSAPFMFAANDTMEFQLNSTFDLVDPGPKTHPWGMLDIYAFDGNFPLGSVTVTFLGAQTKYPPDPKAGQMPVRRHSPGPFASSRGVTRSSTQRLGRR